MAPKETSTRLEPDELVKRLERHREEGLRAIPGYVGEQRSPGGRVRLYETLELTSYVEVSPDDIVHQVSLRSETDPLAGSIVWVKAGADVVHRRVNSQHAKAEFVTGGILSPAPGAAGSFVLTTMPPATSLICVTIGLTIIATTQTGGAASDRCCPSQGCSAQSQCLCSGGGQQGPSCNVC